jgi:hypothetical protein
MTALATFLLLTALGVLGSAAIITASPTLPGVITSAIVLTITATMGVTVALLIREALDGARGRGPEHLKAGRVKGFLSGGAE